MRRSYRKQLAGRGLNTLRSIAKATQVSPMDWLTALPMGPTAFILQTLSHISHWTRYPASLTTAELRLSQYQVTSVHSDPENMPVPSYICWPALSKVRRTASFWLSLRTSQDSLLNTTSSH